MSSFGTSGGGSGTSSNGAAQHIMKGLGLDQVMQSIGQQGAQPGGAVQPGKMAQMSPQQRLASIMQGYMGSQGPPAQ